MNNETIQFISLLSGGLDSPVAAYLMMKRGFKPIFLSFLTSDDKQQTMKKKVIQITQILTKFTEERIKLYIINHDPNLNLFKANCERKLTCILCKRLMIRIAKEIGKTHNTNIIVTGDILGEQASQTLDNLYVYNNLVQSFMIIRPLIGWDKQEVINLNKKIGLYELSSQKSASCQFNPQFPETHAKFNEVIQSESRLDLNNEVKRSIEQAEILEF